MKSENDKYNILTCYYRPKPGGFCKRLFRAINALLAKGHTVHYLAVVPFPIDHPACFFHQFPWSNNHTSGYIFWAFFHLYAPVQLFFIGCKYKVNRLFAFGYNYSLLMQPLRLAKKIPLTVFLRGDAAENHRLLGRSSLLVRLEHFLEGLGITGSRMYGVSETLTNKTIAQHRLLKPSTSGVLRNDIVRPTAISKNKRKVKLPLRLACVGMLAPIKNQKFLLEVMKEINAKQAQLYIYGSGPDEAFLKKAVEKGDMMDRVHFMGWVKQSDIWPSIDLLVMPSLHEGAPNAVLEAIGSGVPVLASKIPEHAEILPENHLFPLDNFFEWEERMINMITDPDTLLQSLLQEQKISSQYLVFNWEEEVVKCIA